MPMVTNEGELVPGTLMRRHSDLRIRGTSRNYSVSSWKTEPSGFKSRLVVAVTPGGFDKAIQYTADKRDVDEHALRQSIMSNSEERFWKNFSEVPVLVQGKVLLTPPMPPPRTQFSVLGGVAGMKDINNFFFSLCGMRKSS